MGMSTFSSASLILDAPQSPRNPVGNPAAAVTARRQNNIDVPSTRLSDAESLDTASYLRRKRVLHRNDPSLRATRAQAWLPGTVVVQCYF